MEHRPVIQKLKTEFEEFKKKTLETTQEEIFEDIEKVRFYKVMNDFLDSEPNVSIPADMTLAHLWMFYLKEEYLSVENHTEIALLIMQYRINYEK